MSQPVLFVLDDDEGVVHALVTDLGRRFDNDFRIIGETSAAAGLAALRGLADAHQPVALLIVDHDLTEMPGVEFLALAHAEHPLARRVLLVERDYSARSPVVRAMTLGQADYHIMKPWVLEQVLYRVVSEFLADWAQDQQVGFDLFRLVGGPHDPATHELREMLARFSVPFQFYAADSEQGRQLLRSAGVDGARLPVMIRHDEHTMVQPTRAQIVQAVGASTHRDLAECDVLIAGAGPAGLAAAVYAASEGLQTMVLEEAVSGGQAGNSPMIRNYPGFAHGVSGYELTRRACEQAWMFGAHMVFAQPAVTLESRDGGHAVGLAAGDQIRARAVILATGIAWRRLGLPRLEALIGRGVFYGAAGAETSAMAGREVFVVGAGNSAGQTTLHLARHARRVTMLVRGDGLARSMSDYLIREIEATPNIAVRVCTEIIDGHGTEELEGLTLRDPRGTEQVPAAALFVLIGGEPCTRWLPAGIQLHDGYIRTGRDVERDGAWAPDRPPLPLETSMPGVFAAGDVRYRSLKRVASAVGDGATVVRLVHEYLATSPLLVRLPAARRRRRSPRAVLLRAPLAGPARVRARRPAPRRGSRAGVPDQALSGLAPGQGDEAGWLRAASPRQRPDR